MFIFVNELDNVMSFPQEDMVCLRSLAGGTSTALDKIIGQYMRLHLLIEVPLPIYISK